MQIYNNNSILQNYALVKMTEEDRKREKYNYLKKVKFDKIDMINKIAEHIDEDIDYDKINKIVNSKRYKVLFSNNKKVKSLVSTNGINGILNNYGLKVGRKKINDKVDGKVVSTYKYVVENMDIINEYLDRVDNKVEVIKEIELDAGWKADFDEEGKMIGASRL